MTMTCHYSQPVTPAPNRNRPLKSYPMEQDLIDGLDRLSEREHLPVAALVRRAIRRELEREGVLIEQSVAQVQRAAGERRKTKTTAGRPRARTRKRP
jgi:hypothetical protein